MIKLLADVITHHIGQGSGRAALIVMLLGLLIGTLCILLRVRDGDGDIVWGWVVAGGIGGAILGATIGGVLTQQKSR